MPSSSPGRRRPPNLNLNQANSPARSPPVPILKSRDPVPQPQTPPSRKAPPTARYRITPPTVSRAPKAPPPSSIQTGHHADDYPIEPSTPVNHAAAYPHNRAQRDYDHDGADMANKENEFLPRDSHDLSLPSTQSTRDSLMANMLLSLDQLTMLGQTTTPTHMTMYDEPRVDYSSSYGAAPSAADRTWSSTSRPTMRQGTKSRFPPTHSYSYSSDLEAGDDAARLAARGRRSNSSSSYHPSIPSRMNSLRGSAKGSYPNTPRRIHTRGSKGSKSSSSNSIDAGYAQVLGSQRWAHGFSGRSSSFDYGHRPINSQQQQQQQQQWQVDFPDSFLNDDYDAAPTPTVPGGPRRTAPPTPVKTTFAHPELPPEPTTPSFESKRSTRSTRSMTASSRKGESKFGSSREAVPPVPPLADLDLDSAPAPNVGYGKTKEPLQAPAPAPAPVVLATPQPKEKPGFFRRVFGSSRHTSATHAPPETHNPPEAYSTPLNDRSSGKAQHTSQVKPVSTPPSRDATSTQTHHVLQKKPSSFFRRRKKSMAEPDTPPVPKPEDVPPVPPVSFQPHMDRLANADVGPEPSPVSSLRKVMSPYLRGNPTTPAASHTPVQSPLVTNKRSDDAEVEVSGYQREFSPDYEPSPNAVIRTVNDDSPCGDRGRADERLDTPTRPPPEIPASSETRNNSFLNLDPPSDNELEMSPSRKVRSAAAVPSPSVSRGSPPANEEEKTNDKLEQEDDDVTHTPLTAPPKSSRKQADETSGHLYPHARPPVTDDTFRPIRRKIRAALEITDSEEDSHSAHSPGLGLPIEGARSGRGLTLSTEPSNKTSPARQTPSVHVDLSPVSPPEITMTPDQMDPKPIDEPEFVVGDPTDDDRTKAVRIFEGQEDFIQKEKAAAWMGAEGTVRQRTLRAYMELYDFGNVSIVSSLRQVCGRLVLRAETQQVDRILLAFSTRWIGCNPNHGFKSIDVVHTICYSIMLLNTDLHMADIEHKMTRSQFVKNTLTTILQAIEDSVADLFTDRPSVLPGNGGMLTADDVRPSVDQPRSLNRFSFLPPPRTDTNSSDTPADDCGPLVKTPFEGTMKAWAAQLEIVLKDIYVSIRDERLPLFGAEMDRYQSGPASQSSLSVMGMLKRTPSVLSKAPSESQSSVRGRIADSSRTTNSSRWVSKSRSRHRLGGTGFSSSRTSFDDGNSVWSPAGSSSATWSRQSLGRTQTSMSVDSFGVGAWPRDDYQQSIGFANALSQAIIREDVPGGAAPSIMSADEGRGAAPLLEDESLELAGPPWVKEGIVTHKHHLDGVGRRAKDRNWVEVFAVIQKGTLSLFSFTPNKSLRSKARTARKGGPPIQVGGGNWQENATSLGSFNLRQTLASALPAPGYSRTRPHVWALSLPTGAVHLFQAGTPEIIKEFVTTSNYWAARLSTHPLMGGVSNMEYGWSDAVVNSNALDVVISVNESTTSVPSLPGSRPSRPGSAATTGPPPVRRGSIASGRSYRSGSFDRGSIAGVVAAPGSGHRHKLPADRVHIADWMPPTQSMRPSTLAEEDQLRTLEAYVRGVEDELREHNQLRSPMLAAFSARSGNLGKAMANWEKRSAYLLREIVKFRTYVDCLQQAEAKKLEIYGEREEREKMKEEREREREEAEIAA